MDGKIEEIRDLYNIDTTSRRTYFGIEDKGKADFTTLLLAIPEPINNEPAVSLDRSLELFFRKQTGPLSQGDQVVSVPQLYDIEKLGDYVILDLGRKDEQGQRITTPVTFPYTFDNPLDLTPYMAKQSGKEEKFALKAVLLHYGTSQEGHYTSYVRYGDRNGQWYKCDDRAIKKVGFETIKGLANKGYDRVATDLPTTLIYERISHADIPLGQTISSFMSPKQSSPSIIAPSSLVSHFTGGRIESKSSIALQNAIEHIKTENRKLQNSNELQKAIEWIKEHDTGAYLSGSFANEIKGMALAHDSKYSPYTVIATLTKNNNIQVWDIFGKLLELISVHKPQYWPLFVQGDKSVSEIKEIIALDQEDIKPYQFQPSQQISSPSSDAYIPEKKSTARRTTTAPMHYPAQPFQSVPILSPSNQLLPVSSQKEPSRTTTLSSQTVTTQPFSNKASINPFERPSFEQQPTIQSFVTSSPLPQGPSLYGQPALSGYSSNPFMSTPSQKEPSRKTTLPAKIITNQPFSSGASTNPFAGYGSQQQPVMQHFCLTLSVP